MTSTAARISTHKSYSRHLASSNFLTVTFDFGEWRSAVASRKNDDGTLPLSKKLRSIAVIGPLADDRRAMLEILRDTKNGLPLYFQKVDR